MDKKFGPKHETRIDLFERFAVVRGELDPFPHFGGEVRAFDGFHVEVEHPGFGRGADGGVAGVGERAGLSVAETCDVVFVSAEIFVFGRSVGGWSVEGWGGRRGEGVVT